MKICVIIPAYNEASTIGGIVKSIKAKGLDIMVVDDGSTDDTGQIASHAGAIVIRHEQNKGKGASLREAFDYIIQHKTDCEAVLTMDADGQHRVDDIMKFLDVARDPKVHMIVGNRMAHPKNMPFIRFITNIVMSGLLSILCKQRIPDTQCGFRLIKMDVLKSVKLTSSNFDTESEILICASRKGFCIAPAAVETIYMGETSDIHPIKDTFRFLILLIRISFRKR